MKTIKLITLCKLGQSLPRCSVSVSAGDLLIIDRNGEAVGQINFDSRSITVYRGYRHAVKVTRRLKRAAIPVELRDQPVMEQVTRILYE